MKRAGRRSIVSGPASAHAVGQLQAHLADFDRTTNRKGREYYERGHVIALAVEGRLVCGVVQGSEDYQTTLEWTNAGWDNSCTCPVEYYCKHAYALGLEWLERCGRGAGVTTAASAKPPATPITFREEWTPRLAEMLGRPLTPDEAAALGRLSRLCHATRQMAYAVNGVWGHQLTAAGFALPEAQRQPDRVFCEDWWDTPPADPWKLWQYLAVEYEREGVPIPAVFAPMTDLAATRTKVEAHLHRQAIAAWLDGLAPPEESGYAPNLVVGEPGYAIEPVHAVRVALTGKKGWTLQWQPAPDRPFKNATQTWLYSMGRQPLSRFAHLSAEQFALLAVAREALGSFHFYSPGGQENALTQIFAHPLARQCVVDAEGQSVISSDVRLAWRLLPDPQQPGRARFHLVWPDGSPAAGVRLLAHGQPSLYLANNVLHPGPGPLAVPQETIPVAVAKEPAVARALLARGVQLPESFEVRVQQVSMRARVECRLKAGGSWNYGGAEMLEVRLVVQSDEPRHAEVWTDGGWEPEDRRRNTPLQLADATLLQFDRSAGQAAAATFAGFGLHYWHQLERWTRSVNRTFAEDFLAWRAQLPPAVEVVATGDLAGLLGAPVRASLAFNLEEDGVQRDWFDLAVALRPEQIELSEDELALLLKARGKFVRLPRLGWRRLETDAPAALTAALDRLGLSADDVLARGAAARHRLHALQLTAEADTLLPAETAGRLRERAAALDAEPVAHPPGLTAVLRPYQEDGFQFLVFLSRHGFGGILADDMGLGKTVQALAWLLWLRGQAPADAPAGVPWRTLIVCPKSVTENWRRETGRFTPALTAAVLDGGADVLPEAEIVICNYAQLRLAQDLLGPVEWAAVILDEGQNIKNPRAQTSQVARRLRTAHRLVLTGTPVENRALDLWSLFAFAQPGWLGSEAAFKRLYDEKAGPIGRARLARRVRHFLLRRTKAQVAPELPARVEEDLAVALEGEQRRLYDAELKRARQLLRGVESEADFRRQRFNILASLLRLRQICCHPALLDPAYAGFASAKLEALMETLEPLLAEGHKVLVFSQFVALLELVAARCAAADIAHLMLTGRTEARGALVDRFQAADGPPVFLLSLRAAGTGLNLTAASYVVLFDPWWNPAVEAQAIDRTHRIGQTSQVLAYRLLAKDTVEEKIRRMQQDKAALARAIVEEDNVAQVMDLASLRLVLGEDTPA
jgi:superfamily II DNA or RNA helicase